MSFEKKPETISRRRPRSIGWGVAGWGLAGVLGLAGTPAYAATLRTPVEPIKTYLGTGGGYTPSLGTAQTQAEATGRADVPFPYVITEVGDWQGTPYQPEHGALLYIDKGPAIYLRRFKGVSTLDPTDRIEGSFSVTVSLSCPVKASFTPFYVPYQSGHSYQMNCTIEEEAPALQSCHGPKGGNPIDVFSGRKEERIPLLDGLIPVALHYNSKEGWRPSVAEQLLDRTVNRPLTAQTDCVRGLVEDGRGGGSAQCFRRLRLSEQVSTPPVLDVVYRQADGSVAEFTAAGRSASPGVVMSLALQQSPQARYLLRKSNEERIFDEDGRLTRVARPDGSGLALTYLQPDGSRTEAAAPACTRVTLGTGLPGQPSCITDRATGRQINLSYAAEGLSRVIGPAGEVYDITYNGPEAITKAVPRDKDLVTTIAFPDGGVMRFGYNEDGRTGGVDLPNALTSKSDLAGQPFAAFTYDANGRAVVSEYLDGIGRTEVRQPAYPSSDYTIVGPDGIARAVTPQTLSYSLGGVSAEAPVVNANQQPAGAGCAAASTQTRYSLSGLVTERVDLNQVKTCYAVDEETMKESSRLEGLKSWDSCAVSGTLPQGARRISTEWHPKWHLATRTVEPLRITTYVYNGQPDPFNGNALASCAPTDARLPDGDPIAVLCRRVELATTDTDGSKAFAATAQAGVAVRGWSWTYNAAGQVLTEKDPRGLTVTTNEYYTTGSTDYSVGDLKSSTNALTQVALFPRFNGHGKPLETRDLNGIATTYTYDARQRLKSMTVAGQTTSYDYWPNGLLKRTTQPDLTTLDYVYDAGQRLIAVADSAGNRIEYVLDASGRRTREDARDPGGALRRTMSRVFDALGRAQQTTGGQ